MAIVLSIIILSLQAKPFATHLQVTRVCYFWRDALLSYSLAKFDAVIEEMSDCSIRELEVLARFTLLL